MGAGGSVHRVFLRSGLNCWSPLPGSGQREVGRLPRLLVARGGCRGGITSSYLQRQADEEIVSGANIGEIQAFYDSADYSLPASSRAIFTQRMTRLGSFLMV